MTCGFIARPKDVESLRRDFDQLVRELETRPIEKVVVVFGYAWGHVPCKSECLEILLSGSELRARVEKAEAEGLGKVGSDDLSIRFPSLGVERKYCHEADIHVKAETIEHPYVESERKRCLDLGWEVYPFKDETDR